MNIQETFLLIPMEQMDTLREGKSIIPNSFYRNRENKVLLARLGRIGMPLSIIAIIIIINKHFS